MSGYVDRVPVLPDGVTSGEKVAAYYEQKNKFREVSLFSEVAFERKLN